MTLDRAQVGTSLTVVEVCGERSFRRRLMELGLLPGTSLRLVREAPLGDPLLLQVRGCQLSIRRAEAAGIHVTERALERT